MRAQTGLPFDAERTPTVSLEDRIADMERYLAHYIAKESAWMEQSFGTYGNPWTGLRRNTERVLDRLRAQRR